MRSSNRTCAWSTLHRPRPHREPRCGDCRRSDLRLAWPGARHFVPGGAAEVPSSRVTLQIGVGIGRLVFRALNTVEALLAVGILIALVAGHPPVGFIVAFAIVVVGLLVQLLGVRPRLKRRSDAVLAGQNAPRSRAHYAYVALEVTKLVALAMGGFLLLTN